MTGKSEAWFTPSIHALQYQSVVVGLSQICCGRRDVRIGFALPAADLVRQGKKEICVRSSPEAERIDGFAPAPEFQPL